LIVVVFEPSMRELILTNDLVLISYVEALLADQGIETVVFDRNISLMEGSIGAFPRRVVVPEEAWVRASRVLQDAGLGNWLAVHERD
jgi:hypothetical protein